jgi:putative ABC transport system permease protein
MLQWLTRSLSLSTLVSWTTFIANIATILITGTAVGMSLRERRRALAVLQAIGFARIRIFWLALLQSVLVYLVGGAIGSLAVTAWFHGTWIDAGGFQVSTVPLRPYVCVLASVIAIGIGGAVGAVPALFAARADVVSALRNV